MSESTPDLVPDREPPLDPEDVHATDLDPEDVEAVPQTEPLPLDADDRIVDPDDDELAAE